MANVLIVEDSKSAAAAHAYILWEFGHTVTFAYNAKEAKEYFQSAHHEVVLLDFDLPDGTGLEVFRALQQVDPCVSVVMVTGKGNECLAAQIIKEGAKDYLTKSSEHLSILPDVVDRVLKEKETQQKLAAKDQELKHTNEILEKKVAELAHTNKQLQLEINERVKTAEALKKTNLKLKETLAELGRSQSQMLQSEKMASIGQLAAGVAHEINNPAGFISSNLFTLDSYSTEIKKLVDAFVDLHKHLQAPEVFEQLPPSVLQISTALKNIEEETEIDFILEDCESLLSECRDGIERISNIVGDLKNFAHPGKMESEYIDINAAIESAINLVWHEIKYHVEISKDFSELPLVQCHPQLIGQVFINLLINASQAMEKNGQISLLTRIESDWIIVQIQDTGKGICKENLSKIFDPFFTTKTVGQGTGLGLKVVYDIIRKHKGYIEVKSTEHVGTEFTIRLPIETVESKT